MAEENATCMYLIDEPFAKALKRMRTALAEANLRIAGEIDLSFRIRRTLLMNIPPCTVLLALPSRHITGELASDPRGAALTPLHVVVSARGARTEVHFLKARPQLDAFLEQPLLATVEQLQRALSQTLEKIGMCSLGA